MRLDVNLILLMEYRFQQKSRFLFSQVEFYFHISTLSILTGQVLFSHIDIINSHWLRFLFSKTEIFLLVEILFIPVEIFSLVKILYFQIRPVWLNGWAFVYELSGWRFESRCSHLNFRYGAYFEQGVLWHSGNYGVWIHCETRSWHDKNIQSGFICRLMIFL